MSPLTCASASERQVQRLVLWLGRDSGRLALSLGYLFLDLEPLLPRPIQLVSSF
jgi:hypothetical protein